MRRGKEGPAIGKGSGRRKKEARHGRERREWGEEKRGRAIGKERERENEKKGARHGKGGKGIRREKKLGSKEEVYAMGTWENRKGSEKKRVAIHT